MIGPLLALAMVSVRIAPGDTLSDAMIVAYKAKHDTNLDPEMPLVLGIHHGTRVIVTAYCSLDCTPNQPGLQPVVHYDLKPGPECHRVGGAIVPIILPGDVAEGGGDFCVPKVLDKQGWDRYWRRPGTRRAASVK
jgi:hypothetical protein